MAPRRGRQFGRPWHSDKVKGEDAQSGIRKQLRLQELDKARRQRQRARDRIEKEKEGDTNGSANL